MRLLPLILGMVLIAAAPARADEIRLRNGSVIQGRIVREDKDIVVIDVGRGRMNLARRDIVAITVSHVESVDPVNKSPAPNAQDPANPPAAGSEPLPSRRVRPTAEETPPSEEASAPVVLPPRRFRGGVPTPGPKIVTVERLPAQPAAGANTGASVTSAGTAAGPESEAPVKKPPHRAVAPTDSKGNASKQSASRATPKPDW